MQTTPAARPRARTDLDNLSWSGGLDIWPFRTNSTAAANAKRSRTVPSLVILYLNLLL